MKYFPKEVFRDGKPRTLDQVYAYDPKPVELRTP